MEINTNSWHYKVYDWTYANFLNRERTPEATNLCQYCQRIFWHTLKYGFFWLLVALLVGTLAYGIGAVTWGAVHLFKWWALLIPVVGFLLYLSRGVPKQISQHETLQLANAWMSARKRGICPLVTFTNGPTKSDE